MGWTGCCCGCTFRDSDFADPDGTTVTEEFESVLAVDVSEASEQIADDGAPFSCRGAVIAPRVPCRQVSFASSVDPDYVFATALVLDMGPILGSTGVGSFSDVYGVHQLGRADGLGYYTLQQALPGLDNVFTLSYTGGQIRLQVDLAMGLYSGVWAVTPTLVNPWDAAKGLNVLDEGTYTLSLVSDNWPVISPAPGAVTLYAGQSPAFETPGHFAQWRGVEWRQSWWRWYDATTFDPDGSPIQIGYLIDRNQTHLESRHVWTRQITTAGPGVNSGARLALRQGSTRAWLSATALATVQSAPWWHNEYATVDLGGANWVQWSTDDTGAISIPFEPDLSEGADPITIGLTCDNSGGALSDYVERDVRFDQFCLRLQF